jgi:hypothetical protein
MKMAIWLAILPEGRNQLKDSSIHIRFISSENKEEGGGERCVVTWKSLFVGKESSMTLKETTIYDQEGMVFLRTQAIEATPKLNSLGIDTNASEIYAGPIAFLVGKRKRLGLKESEREIYETIIEDLCQ